MRRVTTRPFAKRTASRLPALALVALLLGCGGEATAPTPAAPAPAPPTPGAPVAPVAPLAPVTPTAPPAPVGPPIDLLHAAPAALATSSAYHDDLAQVAALVDGSLETAWNSRTGDLTGAWIEVRLPADATVTSIGMTAGFTHVSPRADLFPGNHRVTRVRVLRDGAEVGTYPLDPELRTLQTLPVAGGGGVYRIEIAEVRPGTNTEWREACVSELVVMGHAPGASGGASAPSTAIGTLPALPAAGTSAGPAGEHDGVYFVVPEVGFVRLDPRGAWEVVVRDASYSARPTVDGGWLAREMGVIHQEDGTHFGGPMGSSLTSVDRAPDGTLWATSGGAIAHREGTGWVAAARGASDPFFTHVAVDPAGTVWLGTTTAGLFRLVGGAPSAVELPGGASVRELDVDPSGRLIVTQADRVVARSGETWTLLAMGEFSGARVRADGALAAIRNGAEVFLSPGGAARRIELEPLGVPGDLVRALGWDGAGRLWMDTDAGMVVLEPSLDRLARWYPAGTIDELDGPEGASTIFGIGAGPMLPAAAPPVGVVHGRLLRAGAPVAGAWIEICASPSARYDEEFGGSPCAPDGDDAERVPHARTRADGTFDFSNVRGEALGLAIQEEGRPWVIREVECCGDPSQPFDLGTIELR